MKFIAVIWGLLQIIAAILFVIIIRLAVMWSNGDTTGGVVTVFLVVAAAVQILSIQLRRKYAAEVTTAESILQTSKRSYGWIALAVFGAAVLLITLSVMF